jgi:hypothetical protein
MYKIMASKNAPYYLVGTIRPVVRIGYIHLIHACTMNHIKLTNSRRAKPAYSYKNIKKKLHRPMPPFGI